MFLSEQKKLLLLQKDPGMFHRQFVLVCKIAINNCLQQVPLTAAALSSSDNHVAITQICEWLLLMFSLPSLF